MEYQHGGDIYTNQVELDYSANLNPLGLPEGVRNAYIGAADCCSVYPVPGPSNEAGGLPPDRKGGCSLRKRRGGAYLSDCTGEASEAGAVNRPLLSGI